MKIVATLIITLLLTSYSFSKLNSLTIESGSLDNQSEVLYLPNGIGLKTLSFGYTNFAADILWFKTVNYFGKHFTSDKDYTWLNHMCGLVTDLDSRLTHVFDFCANMLSWEAGLPEKSVAILTKSINSDSSRWRSYYLRGFTSMYFLDDPISAQSDFVTGSKLPEAPPFLARLAAKKISMSDPIAALGFLSEAIQRANDPIEKQVLKSKFKEIQRNISAEKK